MNIRSVFLELFHAYKRADLRNDFNRRSAGFANVPNKLAATTVLKFKQQRRTMRSQTWLHSISFQVLTAVNIVGCDTV
jgi:hypothetical protein